MEDKTKRKNRTINTIDVMIKHADKGPSGFWVDDYEGCGNPLIFPEFNEGLKHGKYISKEHIACPWDKEIALGSEHRTNGGCYHRCLKHDATFLKTNEIRNILARFKERVLNGDYDEDYNSVKPLLTKQETELIKNRIKQKDLEWRKQQELERQEVDKKADWLIAKWPQFKDYIENHYEKDTVIAGYSCPLIFSNNYKEEVVGAENMSYNEYLDAQFSSLGKDCHSGFAGALLGNELSYRGKIERMNDEYVCFNKIFIDGMYPDGECFVGKEDHVWMSIEGFRKHKVGDCLSFEAETYRYVKTSNGRQIAYGLRNPNFIRKVDDYKLPTSKELYRQAMQQIECEVCLFTDHCDRVYCLKGKRCH